MTVRLGGLSGLCLILSLVLAAGGLPSPGGHHLQVNATLLDEKKNESTNAVSKISNAPVTSQQLPQNGLTGDKGLISANDQISNYTGIDNAAEIKSQKADILPKTKKIKKKKRNKNTENPPVRTSSRRMRKVKVSQTADPVALYSKLNETAHVTPERPVHQSNVSTKSFIGGIDILHPNNISDYTSQGLTLNQPLSTNGTPTTPNITGNLSITNKQLSTSMPTQNLNTTNELNNILQQPSNLTINKAQFVTNPEILEKDMRNSNLTTNPQAEILSNTNEPIKKAIKSRFFLIKKTPKTNDAAINPIPLAVNRTILINNLSRFSKLRRQSSRSSLNKTRHEITETIIHEYEHPEITTKKPKPIRREGGPKFFLIKEPPPDSTKKPQTKPMPKLVTRRMVSKKSHTTTSTNSTNSLSSEKSSNLSQLVISGTVANTVPQLITSALNTTPLISDNLTTKPVSMESSFRGLNVPNETALDDQQSSGNNIISTQNMSKMVAGETNLYGFMKSNKVSRKSTKRKRKKVKKTMKKTSRQIKKQMTQLLKNNLMLNTLHNNTKIN